MHENNIDSDELTKFANMAESWWDEQGELKTLHHINPSRLAYVTKYTSLEGMQVLDVGCGGGILTESMADLGAQVTGIDANPSAIAAAKIHRGNTQPQISYETITAEEYVASHKNSFDVVTCMELLEHVPDIDSLLYACSELLKPNGWLFLSTVNRTLKSYLSAIVAAEYVLNLLPKGTHDYDKFIKPAEIASSLRRSKFELVDISGMQYLPGIHISRLTDDPSVNYLVCARALA